MRRIGTRSNSSRSNRHLTQTTQADPAGTLRDLAVSVLDDAKAEDIQIFDLRQRNTFADYMIIASGFSTRQVKAMSERLVQRVKRDGRSAPLGVEGEEGGEWVLVDLADVVVHMMLPQTRAFYNLEKLWSAPVEGRTGAGMEIRSLGT